MILFWSHVEIIGYIFWICCVKQNILLQLNLPFHLHMWLLEKFKL